MMTDSQSSHTHMDMYVYTHKHTCGFANRWKGTPLINQSNKNQHWEIGMCF